MPLPETLLEMPEQRSLAVDTVQIPKDLGGTALWPDVFTDLLPGEEIDTVLYPDLNLPEFRPPVKKVLEYLVGKSKNGKLGGHPSLAAFTPYDNEKVVELQKYQNLFGRDSLVSGGELLKWHPQVMLRTLRELAVYQGTDFNQAKEEEPGRILHEMRKPEIDASARRITEERGWGWPYYGSIDSTPLFMVKLAEYRKKAGSYDFIYDKILDKDGNEKNLLDSFLAASNWLERRMYGDTDNNPEGFLEYKTPLEFGLENEAWKDSFDSYSHSDGSLANKAKPVASVEVEALAYDALLASAEIHEKLLGDTEKAAFLRARAAEKKQNVLKTMWVDDELGGYLAIGTDRGPDSKAQALDIKTSNMGHVLDSGFFDPKNPADSQKVQAIIRHLFAPDMLVPSGIRTLSSLEKRFRATSYHNGSVWLWDNRKIAKGLRRHGYHGLSNEINKRIHEVCNATNAYPEYVPGYANKIELSKRVVIVWDSEHNRKNNAEEIQQLWQAWTAASYYAIEREYREGKIQLKAANSTKRKFEEDILSQITQSSFAIAS